MLRKIRFGRGLTLFKQAHSPFYNLRVMVKGRRRQFSTGETTEAKALSKAKAILADLKSRGMPECIALHARRVDVRPTDPTIEELIAIYEKAMTLTECPPSTQTQARYANSFRLVCRHLKVGHVRALTGEKVKQFIGEYQDEAKAAGRAAKSIRVSLNSILRSAAAVFSRAALASYADQGMAIVNPFDGLKLRRVEITEYSPLKPEVLQSIWANASRLRDGDPRAALPSPPMRKNGKRQRWSSGPDFREPQVAAYLLLLLELGLGLRRNESDKAQWDWIIKDSTGRYFLEVRATPYFVPKSGKRRVIPLAKSIQAALTEFKGDSPFIVPGREPTLLTRYAEPDGPKHLAHRCDQHHRTLAMWLRQQGIVDKKPCHVLRKQFGSFVATTFSLFHAQKFLGHSSPKVTSDYYAGLVELPELDHVKLLEQ